MSGSGEFDGLEDFFRGRAIAAGISTDILDGPHRCFAGCGAIVQKGSDTCSACTKARIEAEHNDALRRAWSTVPELLRWASLSVPKMSAWVKDSAALNRAREISADQIWRPLILLTGEPGAGKTTLACALMREWMLPGARRAASHRARDRAHKARFAAAHRLVRDRAESRLGDHVVDIDLARAASLLVLDEVGRGVDTHAVIFDLLHERHDSGRPTIMTTPFKSSEDLAAATDGGLARRVFDDSLVIHVRKVAA